MKPKTPLGRLWWHIENAWIVLTNPGCWTRLGIYSREFEEWCLDRVVNGTFTNYDGYTVDLGGKSIWIASHPYASWDVWLGRSKAGIRPGRAVTIRLQLAMLAAVFATPEKGGQP